MSTSQRVLSNLTEVAANRNIFELNSQFPPDFSRSNAPAVPGNSQPYSKLIRKPTAPFVSWARNFLGIPTRLDQHTPNSLQAQSSVGDTLMLTRGNVAYLAGFETLSLRAITS